MATRDPQAASEIERLVRDAAPAALAVLLRRGDPFADAEDAVQDAVILAVESWPERGIPDRPVGWMVRVAQRRLIDRHRRDTARVAREALVASWSQLPEELVPSEDDSLALLFLCCHEAVTPGAAIPLTLRAVGGLTTAEIADALLQSEATIAQRISRAKASIARSGEPFRRDPADLIDDRLPAVMQIIYLIFNEGHAATKGPRITRTDLADEAIHLARQLQERLPDRPEAAGLLALLLLTDARRAARSVDGVPVPLDDQDRAQWDQPMITEGLTLLTEALGHHALGDYQIQAAIAAIHDQAPSYAETNWTELRALYNLLLRRRDNPFVRLNRAVAIAHTDGPDAALREIKSLSEPLADHHRYYATIGYIHDLAGRHPAAESAYESATSTMSDPADLPRRVWRAYRLTCLGARVAMRTPMLETVNGTR